jgi:hypothetical protein
VADRTAVRSPSVWRPSELTDHDWSITLAPRQRQAIIDAARSASELGATIRSIDRQAFPLPALADDIADWSHRLGDGLGFLRLREFPIDVLTPHEVELAYTGLGTHLGKPVGQNQHGELLTHIVDERLPEGFGKVRLYRTRMRQDFHSDGADIIGLLCLHTALRGGASRIVSSGALYNEILRTRPDLLDELYAPMCWDRQGDHASGEPPWFQLAPISDLGGVPRLFYIGWYIRDAQQHADVPRLTPAQLEAMELLESLANDPAFHLEMQFEPGDVQLLNNGRILHAREAYDDHDDLDERRHLLRLWLAAHTFASVDDGLRAGINTPR